MTKKPTILSNKFYKDYKQKEILCNAILIKITRNIINNYPIPPIYKLREFIGTAIYDICEIKENRLRDWNTLNIEREILKNPDNIPFKILDQLIKVINKYTGGWLLREHLDSDIFFTNNKHSELGYFYRFVNPKQEKQKVLQYFSKKDLKIINKIAEIVNKCIWNDEEYKTYIKINQDNKMKNNKNKITKYINSKIKEWIRLYKNATNKDSKITAICVLATYRDILQRLEEE